MHEATARDARVALLECVCFLITLQHGREGVVPIQQRDVRPVAPRSRVAPVGEIPSERWEQLDQVNLDDVFLHRVPMMKSCPRFLRGRLRFCFGLALRRDTVPRVQGTATRRSERGSCSASFLFCFSIGPNTVARLAGMNSPSVQTM